MELKSAGEKALSFQQQRDGPCHAASFSPASLRVFFISTSGTFQLARDTLNCEMEMNPSSRKHSAILSRARGFLVDYLSGEAALTEDALGRIRLVIEHEGDLRGPGIVSILDELHDDAGSVHVSIYTAAK